MAERKLSRYNAKRDFKKTAEPSGEVAHSKGGNRYLIQKHAASRLHYDFRLELDGVLKSWAVTRGPSIDPHDRRLAVEVEDHPVAYGDFEGVIPQGEYGGGTVMLWDHGTWEPLGDPAEELKKGSLHFKLHGERLQGEWSLVRMKDRPQDRGRHNWLLLKRSDRHAKKGKAEAFLKKHATSIVSQRDMEAIAKDADRTWGAKPAKKTATPVKTKTLQKVKKSKYKKLPGFLEPQLATLVDSLPQGKDWVHEVKFDGYRVLSYLENGEVRMFTRGGLDWTEKFGDLGPMLAELKLGNAIFDGELVALNEQNVSSFSTLKNALSEKGEGLSYYVFDLLFLDGEDMRQQPLLERKKRLKALFERQPLPRVFYSEHFTEDATFLQRACSLRLEGVISKRADAPYQNGRGKSWLKTKCHQRQEFVIGGFTLPGDGGAGIGSLLLGYYAQGKFTYAGRVGTGFDHATARALRKQLTKLKRSAMAYEAYSDAGRRGPGWKRGVVWVKPELVCEVEFTEWTEEGALRHPSFQGLREDKPARTIKRDTALGVTEAKQAAKKEVNQQKQKAEPVPEHLPDDAVTLTHPEKVLWPDTGNTKQDLADYYTAVAKWMLPHIANRPLSLVRCPAGSGKHCFFQRHSGQGISEHIESLTLTAKDEPYLYIRDLNGLRALVQMGVLEIHQWGSHVNTWNKPDMIVFDFDPAPDVPFTRVKEAAIEMRARLAKLKLKSFVKTTGGKGLHVVLPITPKHDWETIKQWARAMSELMAQDSPKRYTTNMRKSERTGRIFIDYLRNGETATAISPYSTRARDGAPVGVPLDWKELPQLKAGNTFTLKTVSARLKKLKRDPWAAFFTTQQDLPLPKKKT